MTAEQVVLARYDFSYDVDQMETQRIMGLAQFSECAMINFLCPYLRDPF